MVTNAKKYNSKMKAYSLNLNKITPQAIDALIKLDNAFVGTPNYMGISYFWNHEYRHYMRNNRKNWVKIHTLFLKEKLDVSGVSSRHKEIIKKYSSYGPEDTCKEYDCE